MSRGAYLPADQWQTLGPSARYGMRVRAVAATHPGIILARAAAAAVWALPWIGARPMRVDVLAPTGPSGSTPLISRHVEPETEVVEIDGMLVTGLARTVVDIARGIDLHRAVAIAYAALNEKTRGGLALVVPAPDLERELAEIAFRHGEARARHVVDFADGRSGSPIESSSRLTIDELGLPSPVLQHPFPRTGGGLWWVDFWWPEVGLVGECDGAAKYLDPALRNGRTADQVVYDEKLREDDIRRRCRAFARWGARGARRPESLAGILAVNGLGRPVGYATDRLRD